MDDDEQIVSLFLKSIYANVPFSEANDNGPIDGTLETERYTLRLLFKLAVKLCIFIVTISEWNCQKEELPMCVFLAVVLEKNKSQDKYVGDDPNKGQLDNTNGKCLGCERAFEGRSPAVKYAKKRFMQRFKTRAKRCMRKQKIW